jgi:acetoin utilization deacetylase AcuC-like enzyme
MKVSGEGFGALAAVVQNIAARTCGGKVLITLEGGYNPQGLREGVRSVLNTFLGQAPHRAGGDPSPAAEQVIKKITAVQGRYWKELR